MISTVVNRQAEVGERGRNSLRLAVSFIDDAPMAAAAEDERFRKTFFESSSSDDDDDDDEAVLAAALLALTSKPALADQQAVGVDSDESVGTLYDVTFEGELDIIWETDWRGKIARVKLFRLLDGEAGQAKNTGVVDIGHILRRVNREHVPDDFYETVLMLKSLESGSHGEGGKFTLTFQAPEGGAVASEENAALKVFEHELFAHKTSLYRAQAAGLTKGFVEVYKGDFVTTFHLHRESDQSFVCGASCSAGMSGDFIFHTLVDMDWGAKFASIPTHPSAHCYLGRMVKNFTGTKFTLHDYRVVDPRHPDSPKHELATILYKANMTGRDPNAFTAIIPRYDEEYLEQPQEETLLQRYETTRKTKTEDKSFIEKLKMSKKQSYASVEQNDQAELLILKTMSPVWNSELDAWTLDFDGRVKLPNKRNFIVSVDSSHEKMVQEFGETTTLLRHGQMSEHRFCLDYRYPLSPVQALAIVLTSFSQKLLVT